MCVCARERGQGAWSEVGSGRSSWCERGRGPLHARGDAERQTWLLGHVGDTCEKAGACAELRKKAALPAERESRSKWASRYLTGPELVA